MGNTWYVSKNEHGYFVTLFKSSSVFAPLNMFANSVEFLDGLTNHFLCGDGWPQWCWKIPLFPTYYANGWPKYSPPSVLHSLFSNILFLPDSQLTMLKMLRVSAKDAKMLGFKNNDWEN